ncbi:spermidine/putrescine ABC transporter substrate-binding protein [Gammaproteobacteria bacterium SCGC AG-212-F23]|nr:spermidine/putrescine ABC transporter substrate-binding protein [Gammaproteobacteria bacterium SCGC AG-212-F23]
MRALLISLILFFSTAALADENILNVYAWSGVIPDFIIQQFEKETGIKVNFSTYDSNETMYTKLRANPRAGYDIIEPSSYYIDRMRRQQMLEPLDKKQLSHYKNINSLFLKTHYDPEDKYSIPFIWGATGIAVNKSAFDPKTITRWSDLWKKIYLNQLMLLNDSREVFSVALITLGRSINETEPKQIKEAYQKLKELLPNVKLFNSDATISILIDEDATLGMAWNGDTFKASLENPHLTFIYPKDGFVIWVDTFAIPRNAPHQTNAYRFLNFMLRADVAKKIALDNNYPTANLAAQNLLPNSIKHNPIIYPSREVLKRGEFQRDMSDVALGVYEKYWEKLKMGS